VPSGPGWLTDEQREELSRCRQGDVIGSLRSQVWLANGSLPTTEHSRQHAAAGQLTTMAEAAPHGHVILTQTCDLQPQPDRDRPFVALAPLVRLDGQEALARRGRMPRYVHIPAFENGGYFADLDRITTVETGVVLLAARPPGLSTDDERTGFARAVARKFRRFAFPDDLSMTLSGWRDRVVSRHDKEHSPEGALYREAIDVRVSAQPEWDAEAVAVVVTVLFPPGFLPASDPEVEPEVAQVLEVSRLTDAGIATELCAGTADSARGVLLCDEIQSRWSSRCECVGMVRAIHFDLLGADEMTVDAYLRSFSLDMEFLSSA